MKARDLHKFRIVVYSPRIETCVDSIAAIVQQFHPARIELSFPDAASEQNSLGPGRDRTNFIHAVYERLKKIGGQNRFYEEAQSVDLIPMSFSEEDLRTLIHGTDLLDISGTPKKLAIELMAMALQRGDPRIYQLLWLKQYKEDELPQVGKDRFEYLDLTVLPSTSALRRSYVAKSALVTGISVTVAAIAAGYILSRWLPSLAFLNDVLVAVSVVAGFAALYLAVRAPS